MNGQSRTSRIGPFAHPARMSATVPAALSAIEHARTRRQDASKFLAIGEICAEGCCTGHEGQVHDCGASALDPRTPRGTPRSSIRNSVQGLAHLKNCATATGANREDLQCVGYTKRWRRVRC